MTDSQLGSKSGQTLESAMSKVGELAAEATYLVTAADGWLRIDGVDDEDQEIYCWDEDTGDQYAIPFSDIDLATDDFWKLEKMEK